MGACADLMETGSRAGTGHELRCRWPGSRPGAEPLLDRQDDRCRLYRRQAGADCRLAVQAGLAAVEGRGTRAGGPGQYMIAGTGISSQAGVKPGKHSRSRFKYLGYRAEDRSAKCYWSGLLLCAKNHTFTCTHTDVQVHTSL